MSGIEKTLKRETIYRGKILTLRKDYVELPNGEQAFREIVEHRGAAACLVLTPEQKILLVKQYRKPYDEMLYEIPAGKLEKNENPETTIIRELKEEAGIIPMNLEKIGVIYPSPGYTNEVIHLFYVDLYEKCPSEPDKDEIIELVALSVPQVFDMMETGIIADAKTIISLLRCKDRIFRRNK